MNLNQKISQKKSGSVYRAMLHKDSVKKLDIAANQGKKLGFTAISKLKGLKSKFAVKSHRRKGRVVKSHLRSSANTTARNVLSMKGAGKPFSATVNPFAKLKNPKTHTLRSAIQYGQSKSRSANTGKK